MYTHIMVPVDLTLPPAIDRAAEVAGKIAQWQQAKITLMAVVGTGISAAPHDPEAVDKALEDARKRFDAYTTQPISKCTIDSHDVAAELDHDLTVAAEQLGVDLVVVGTHAPRVMDFLTTGHAGYLAKHAKMSVLVVR
ncbi:Universal stress protein G [Shimia sp. SK013]|uniref:universal stress protein n=1 Tax=Shimia sp. SK013 TaxID=1389006 RepID=UPI0006B4C7D1|nr:universal stress protein [Shimia sp. SK013]KPA23265.1 Universal stress protein G [Shimia sp. SK013]